MAQPPRKFTLKALRDEVASGKCLVAVRGKVYDLTKFKDIHPGGPFRLHMAAGRDVTAVVESTHDSTSLSALRKYFVGELAENENPMFKPPNEFARTLRLRAKDYFKRTGQDPKYSRAMLPHYAAPLLGIACGYWLLHWNETVISSLLISLFVTAIYAWSYFGFAVYIVHDGSHSAITHSHLVWDTFTALHNYVMGLSDTFWFYKHVLGHHPFTNVKGADPDISVDPFSPTRFLPSQEWLPIYAVQVLYAPILYGMWTHYARLQDVVAYSSKFYDNIPVNPFNSLQGWNFWAGKAFFIFHRLIVPCVWSKSSIYRVLLMFFTTELFTSWIAAFVFESNHVVEDVQWHSPRADNYMNIDWAQLQVESAQDYSHDDAITTFLTGSLNFQVVHHLFPSVNQYYYPDLAKIVKATCEEYGIHYIVKSSFLVAMRTHMGLLDRFSSPPAEQASRKRSF